MVNNERLGRALDQITFRGMGGNDVANFVRHAALQGQGHAGKGVAQGLAPLALAALPIGAEFVFEQLAHVRQNSPGNHDVHINRQRPSHELLHGFGTLARDVHHTALVFHEADRTIRHQQRERDLIQILGLQGAAFERLDPGLGNLLTQFWLLDPLYLRPQPGNDLPHGFRSSL